MTLNITGNNPLEIMISINQVAGGMIFASLLVVIWIILFMRQRDEPVREAVTGATYITAILGFLLSVLGLMGDRYFSITFFLMIGAIALLINKPDK